jgi:hypothetical protein
MKRQVNLSVKELTDRMPKPDLSITDPESRLRAHSMAINEVLGKFYDAQTFDRTAGSRMR